MKSEKIIFDLIRKEEERQINGIELIASENFVSENVLNAAGSVLTNKYAEGYPGKRYYGGCEVVDEIESIAIDRAKELFGAEYANVQPHSGSQANASVFHAFLKPGDKLLGFDLSHGGHLTHGSSVNFSGKIYNTSFYGVEKDSGTLDYENILRIAHKEKPQMIIAGASAYSRDIDFSKFRDIADEVNAFLLADISHPAGLIAKGLLNDPIPHCHVVTTTTHKTLRGARGGLILMGKDFENPFNLKYKSGKLKPMSNQIDMGVFPGNQGGPLEHIIAAKAVGLVLPELAGKLDGMAVRVPTVNVSLVDLTFIASRETTAEEVNAAVKAAATEGAMAEVLEYNELPLVSIDFNHNPASSVFDSTQTKVDGKLVKVMAWYDNEWGFSNRMCDLAEYIHRI